VKNWLGFAIILVGYLLYNANSAPHTVSKGWFGLQRQTDLGYRWQSADSFVSYKTNWVAGVTSLGFPHLTSGSEEGKWVPDAGYSVSQDSGSPIGYYAVWAPGNGHPEHPHIHAASAEGTWEPDSGYQLAVSGSLDAVPIPANSDAQQLANTSTAPSGVAVVVGGIAAIGCAISEKCRNIVGGIAKEVVVRKMTETSSN
jgi:hypothetical protein